jgi:ketosteroid isomerase-like protein
MKRQEVFIMVLLLAAIAGGCSGQSAVLQEENDQLAAELAGLEQRAAELETELHTAQQDLDRVANTEELLREWQAAIEALDLERTMTFYAGDATYEDPAQINTMYPAVMKGHQIRGLYHDIYSLPEVSFEFASFIVSADGSKAVAEWVWRGEHFTTGVEYTIRGVSLLEIQDGRIMREVIIYDTRNSPYG